VKVKIERQRKETQQHGKRLFFHIGRLNMIHGICNIYTYTMLDQYKFVLYMPHGDKTTCNYLNVQSIAHSRLLGGIIGLNLIPLMLTPF
jgi:hypothetical protein